MTSRRHFLRGALGATTLLSGMGATSIARAATVLKVGTLFPKASPWGQVFTVWADAVSKKSGGSLELQFFFNGAQGDEGAMVGKMKEGQLDGAALTQVGLSKIYKPVLALQMPGLFKTWAKLDAARDATKAEWEKGIADAGFTSVGWGDVGAARFLSKGFPIRRPDDIKGKKPWFWRDDLAAPIFFQVLGGATPVPLNVPEVLPNLNTGAVNVAIAAPLFAEQMQWASKLDTVLDEIHAFQVGGVVFSSKRLSALSEDLRSIVLDTGRVAVSALTKRIRAEDDAAFARLKGKATVVTLSADDRAKWDALAKQVRQRLAQGTFSAELVAKLEGLAK